MKDYQEKDFEELPKEVQNVINTYNTDNTNEYAEAQRIINELNQIGWTADYDLSGTIYDIKKIEQL